MRIQSAGWSAWLLKSASFCSALTPQSEIFSSIAICPSIVVVSTSKLLCSNVTSVNESLAAIIVANDAAPPMPILFALNPSS